MVVYIYYLNQIDSQSLLHVFRTKVAFNNLFQF